MSSTFFQIHMISNHLNLWCNLIQIANFPSRFQTFQLLICMNCSILESIYQRNNFCKLSSDFVFISIWKVVIFVFEQFFCNLIGFLTRSIFLLSLFRYWKKQTISYILDKTYNFPKYHYCTMAVSGDHDLFYILARIWPLNSEALAGCYEFKQTKVWKNIIRTSFQC